MKAFTLVLLFCFAQSFHFPEPADSRAPNFLRFENFCGEMDQALYCGPVLIWPVEGMPSEWWWAT